MMHVREQIGGRLLPSREDGNLMLIALLFHTSVTFPSIGMYNATRLYGLFDERFQTGRRSISDASHPYSSGPFSIFLCRNNYKGFFLRLPSPKALFRGTHVGLVNLDPARQSVTSRADHGTPQLVQPRPRGLVARQTENSLHAQSTGSGLQGRYPPDQSEPHSQRLTCTMENSSCRHRCLITATGALNQPLADMPALAVSTPRTQVPIRPAQLEQVVQAGFFRREPRFKFSKCSGIVFHSRKHYMSYIPESRGYPPLTRKSVTAKCAHLQIR